MEEITKLADILRNNGDKILNNESKLTLSCDLLKKINNGMKCKADKFYQVKHQNSNKNEYLDLEFLCDFIRRTKSLKLLSSNSARQACNSEFVDISSCKDVKLLEMYKIDVNFVLGIELLRTKLQYLICERSINSLVDILENCGGDNSDGRIWNELKEVSFTHNNLQVIESCIEYVPWITFLDLSHNRIENADVLCCLGNLKYLNLGYNKLIKVPSLQGPIVNRLQVFVLSNNFIEDIQEVQNMLNLCELDLSENCLIEHSFLVPLACLATLQCLNLKGNPLSYHPHHRLKTSRYLHPSTANIKFILDDFILNNSERQLVGSLYPKHRYNNTNSFTASASYDVANERNRRVRHVTITDSNVLDTSNIIETDASHNAPSQPLQTKKQIPKLPEDYIKSLYSQSSLQNLSLPVSSTPYDSTLINTFGESSNENEVASREYVSADNAEQQVSSLKPLEDTNASEITSEPTSNTYITAAESLGEEKNPFEDSSEDEELESGESNIFIATIKGSSDDIFVIITKTHLAEKDQITTKGLGRFALDQLAVCEMVKEDDVSYVYLKFDTLREDSTRYYCLQGEEAERFYGRLKIIVDNRLPPEEKSVNYHCMKCSSKFAIKMQKTIFETKVVCSVCSSDLVFEDGT